MSNPDYDKTINAQYDVGGLRSRIASALETLSDLDSPARWESLSSLDELHIGGREASLKLARRANLRSGDTVLDVGSGLGGPARLLAREFGCRVTGLDLTLDYCEIAKTLTEFVELTSHVKFRHGDALDMPFESQQFDAVWLQHCSMNIPDKRKLYSEVRRVLKTEGTLIIHDVVTGPNQPILYPVVWANHPDLSFLLSPEELRAVLRESGFTETHWNDITGEALDWFHQLRTAPKQPVDRPRITQKLIFKESIIQMSQNVQKNLAEERIRVVESLLKR